MAKSEKISKNAPSKKVSAKVIRQRFLTLNRDRLMLARNTLKKRQQIFVDILPLLFHINHPALPGFVSKTGPAGISDFAPSQQAIASATKNNSEFYYERRAMHIYNIQALYMIGSSGTIAYSEKSDFDIWVCHRKEIELKHVRLLEEKCELIRQWAESLKLEVTFFVMNAESFASGKISALSNESSGSAQFHLLLEEFYRTGLLLAGKYPAWWLVPPDANIVYKKHLKSLHKSREIPDYEYLDFGDLSKIPSGEFFGAAVWQLNKAIGSPYKSLLKLLLIETYASEYPNMDLLCTRYKRAVYDGNVKLTKLDPYVMMSRKVEEYLLGIDQKDRCELARRCFYFKINKKLSLFHKKNLDPRQELLLSLVRDWGWDMTTLQLLDARSDWKIDRVIGERTSLVKELTRSYRMLSDFARSTASESHINKQDLNLLGRRLYAAFERKTGKIEIVNPGISTDLTESRLSFAYSSRKNNVSWVLYKDDFEHAISHKISPIKRSESMLGLIAWSHFNKLLGPQTLVTLHDNRNSTDSTELLALIDSFQSHFPNSNYKKPDIEELRYAAHLTQATLYINIGIDPLASHTQRGVHYTTNRSDALSFGGIWKNLATSFDLLATTNWGEILTFQFKGQSACIQTLCDFLNWFPLDAQFKPPKMSVFSFSSTRGNSIARRVQQLFNDVVHVFYHTQMGEYIRYVVNVGSEYYILKIEKSRVVSQRLHDEKDLLTALGQTQEFFSHIILDRYTFKNQPLALLLKRSQPNKVQMFFEEIGKEANIWVLDEKGSLFYQRIPFHSLKSVVGHYSRFLAAAILRCNASEHSADLSAAVSLDIEYYNISKASNGRNYLKQLKDDYSEFNSDYFGIQVIGQLNGENSMFSMFCNGNEFSSLEFGDNVLQEVAKYVLKFRNTHEKYPIYITDVEVPRNDKSQESNSLQTINYLDYKKIIEARLNAALKDL
ncbi:Adenylate cyclase [hydrothermal vent metagenome]|uniref:Adenylate cyclase n=1 Tax=hydrothermal vent metagenome TaxID=652676 RepID=A0A3B0XXM9_9ZZZZ